MPQKLKALLLAYYLRACFLWLSHLLSICGNVRKHINLSVLHNLPLCMWLAEYFQSTRSYFVSLNLLSCKAIHIFVVGVSPLYLETWLKFYIFMFAWSFSLVPNMFSEWGHLSCTPSILLELLFDDKSSLWQTFLTEHISVRFPPHTMHDQLFFVLLQSNPHQDFFF